MNYSIPGNVRELKAIIELACVMSTTNTITAEDINIQLTTITLEQIKFEDKTLEEYIEEIVTAYIKKYNGNIKEVASKLGVGKTTLYRMIKKNPHLAEL
jgi:DNA-binding NtrC family response regulator